MHVFLWLLKKMAKKESHGVRVVRSAVLTGYLFRQGPACVRVLCGEINGPACVRVLCHFCKEGVARVTRSYHKNFPVRGNTSEGRVARSYQKNFPIWRYF